MNPETMEDVPNVGDEGEIWMKGPIIMKGVSCDRGVQIPEMTR